MIEPDINERMARFAPSQRGSFMRRIMEGSSVPEQRDVEYPSMPDYTGAKIAEDVAAMGELSEPAAPVRPVQSSPIAEDIAEQARQNLNASLVGVRTVNPDEAAKAMRLGRQLDLPPEVVRADMRRAEEQEYLDRLRSRDILRNDPVLANYLANREFANIAHDDIDNLTAIERTFKFFRDIPTGLSEGYTKAVSQSEMADIIERQRQRGGYLEEYEKAALESYNRELAALSVETGLAEAGAYLFVQQAEGWKQEDIDIILAGGVIGGGAGLVGGPLAPATVPAGMALGLKAGLSTAFINRSLRMERALLYAELEPELGHDLANQIATGVGVLNASLDVGALGIVTKPLREPFKAAFRQSVKEAVKKQTVRQAFGRFGLWYAGSAATEVGTETLQELNNVLGMELGLYLQDKPLVLTTEEGRAEVADRLANIAAETALGMVTVGLPGPALQFYTDVRKSAKATRDHKLLENITKTVAESKVLPRDAATMEQYIASTAAGTDAETTYIDAAVAHDILRQSGLTELEMDAVLPGVRQQIEQYQSDGITLVGADVTIPTAQFAARLAKTPLQSQLLPHARLSADAPSLVEAQRIRAEHDQRRAEAEQIIAQQEATNGTFVQEAREIEDTLASQIQATGQMDERAARSSAQFMRDFYVTQAASMGLTPKQVYERFPVRVEGEGMAAPAVALEQAARMPKVDGVELRKDIRRYANGEIDAREFIASANLFGLVTEAEVSELLEEDYQFKLAGVSTRGGGMMSLPGEMGKRGQHPLLALVRKREKERPTAVARRDAEYLDAVQRGDMNTANRMVEEVAWLAGYKIKAFHGTDAPAFDVFGNFNSYNFGDASYFSPNRTYAEEYAEAQRTGKGEPRVLSVVLNLKNTFSPERNEEHLALYKQWAKEPRRTQNFFVYGPIEEPYGPTGVRNLIDWQDQWWLADKIKEAGFDSFTTSESDGETIAYGVFNPNQIKLADPVTRDEQGNVVPLSRRFDITSAKLFEQAAPGPARGGFDPRRLTTILNKTADLSTFLHESAHAFLTFYEQVAQMPDAPARIVNDLDEVLRWAGIAGDTPQARLAAWNGMTLDQKRKAHEQFAYSFEVYLFEGKAPSAEMQGLFERFSAWLKRVYRSIRDDLNAIYRREFGEDLPILTGEVRQVMDRMLATDEQIARQAAINEMKPMFQTREEAMAFGMPEAEWAAFQQMQQEAIEASVIDMNVASMRQMQWLGNARSRVLREVQKKHDARRKEVAVEIAAEVKVEPVYRAMTYLRTGKFVDADGAEVAIEGPHRLDTKRVKKLYETVPTAASLEAVRATGMPLPAVIAPDIAKLGTGKNGMMGLDGLDPDLVAETFGYSSGDEMIRALVAARPMKEIVAERTDAEMLRRFGDMNTPEAVEAEVQAALHNEARARMVAVQLRFVSKATEPARVMVDAAKQVARDLIAAKRVRDVRPSDFVAAEARAARDSEYLVKYEAQPKIAGRAEYDRVYNLALSAGSTEEGAITAATAAQEAFVATQRALRAEEFRARFGPTTPQEALIRAQRAQLYQNQLAAEALRVKAEVDKQVKYLRRVLRDENVKRMGADATDQVRAILDNYSLVSMTRAQREQVTDLRNWLAQAEADGTLLDIDPSLADLARRKNYTELTVEQFRDLVDSVKQIEYRGKNERNIYLAGQKLVFEEMRDGVVASMTEVAEKKGRKVRKDLGDEDRKWMNTIASYDASQQTIANIVYVLDGGKRDGPLAKALIMPANDAGNQEAADRAVVSEKVNDIVGPLAKKGQFAAPKMHFPHIGESLSLEQRMVIALNYGNQSNIDRLLNGEQWTADQARVIIESLTEEQLQAVQAIWDVMSSFRDRVAEKSRRLTGKEPRWLEPLPMSVTSADGRTVELRGGYYPAKYNPRRSVGARELDIAADAERLQREAYTATTTSRSFEKNRSDKPPVDQVLSRQFVAMYAGLNEVIHDLAWHDFAIAATKLLRDKSFQRVIKERYGLETYNSIKDWVDVVVAGDRTKYDAFEQVAIFARQNVSVSAMGIRLMTAAVQPTGIFPAMTRVGIGPMVRAIAEFAYSPVQTSRNVLSRSSFMQSRGRTRFRDLNEIQNIVQEQSRFQRVRRTYIASAYVLTSFTQGLVDTSVWMAAYSNAIKAGKSEKDAVFVADQTVIDTQGSGRVQDLSSAMRGGKKQSAYAKLFTPFYQYSNTMYSLFGAQMRTAPTYGKAAKDALLIMTVGAIVEELIRHALKPSQDEIEPEELAKKLAANQIDFVVGLPFGLREFRGAGSLIMGTDEGVQSYRGPSGLRIVTDATQAAVQARQGEFDAAFRRAVINLLGTTAGIPSAQINDTINGIEAVMEGEVEGAEAVLAPVTGVRR